MSIDRYAVFGNPIGQSKSPEIHQAFAKQTDQNISYEKYCVEIGGFDKAARRFFSEGGKGLNITSPFKFDAYEFADELSETAKMAEAVNTLTMAEDGVIRGDTTDGRGLVADLQERLDWQLHDKDILILGAGGAVRGVIMQILKQTPRLLSIANRTVSKAEALAQSFSHLGNIHARAFDDEPGKTYDIIINGTSASLSGELPPLHIDAINRQTCVYDMVYRKDPTPFMAWADEVGARRVADGLGMLVGQAAESFRIWRGVSVQTSPIIRRLQQQL